jgi:Tfp pilus assembly protein PilV
VSKKYLNDERAFSLLEVLVAMALFTFLVIGVLTMTTMGIRTNSYAQHHTKAVQLAESGLELLRRVNYNTIPNYLEYRRSFTVNYALDISTLQVAVTWRNHGVESIPIVLTTQRAVQ